MIIQEIENKMVSTWNDEVKAVIDTWTSYFVTLEEFQEAVINKALKHGQTHGAIAFIIDSTKANGFFSEEIQEYIEKTVFKKFVESGIKYFITVNSRMSVLTNMTIKSYTAKAGPSGIKLVELHSVDDAIKWLKINT